MRIVCLEQNRENSFLSELKKIEVSSLCVLHLGCFYEKSLLSSIDRQSKLKSQKVAKELIKGPQLSFFFFIMRSISCSTTLLTKTCHSTPFLSFCTPSNLLDSFCGLYNSKEGTDAPLSLLLSHEIHDMEFQAEYFVWIYKWIIYLFCERSDQLNQKHSSRLVQLPDWLQLRINHSLWSLWICIPTGESFCDRANS